MNTNNKENLKCQRKRRFIIQYNIIKNKYNFTDAQIAENIECSLSTLKDSINPSNHLCNPDLMISFCYKYGAELGIDINYLYYGVKSGISSSSSVDIFLFPHSSDFHILEDKAYMGTFYGYCQNSQYDTIDKFKLIIGQNEKGSYAKLILSCSSISIYGEIHPIRKELIGIPMVLSPDLLYICFQADRGNDMYVMGYKYIKINGQSNHLYCAYGALMTIFRGTAKCPQQQSFIISNNPIKEENMHYIEGFLRLTQDKIIVPADILDDKNKGLLTTNKAIKTFFENSPQMNLISEKVYCISEKMLLALGEANGIERSVTAEAILTLKENSINPKKINYPVIKLYSKFISELTDKNNSKEPNNNYTD